MMLSIRAAARRARIGLLGTVLGTLLGTLLAAVCTTALAGPDEVPDHPAVSRYPGAVIWHHDYKEFEEAQLLLSKPYEDPKTRKTVADKVLPVEGKVTYLHYEIPGTASPLQVFRNYQSALKRSGFTELFVCNRPCYDNNLGDLSGLLKARDLYLNGHVDNQYLAAQRGDTYVSLAVNSYGSGSATHAWLFVIEKDKLDDGKMAVTGDSAIAKALNTNGRVDLYGFYFDTAKAELKPGSDATLNELAQVLKDNPALQIDVVGHTDDVGNDKVNQSLSQARAQAVVAALSGRKGIAAERMAAIGRGATQPVASNKHEDGRAKNRRVEIVARAGATAPAGNAQASAAKPAGNAGSTAQAPASAPAPSNPQPAEPAKPAVTLDNAKSAVEKVKSLKGLFGF